ncbi:hypothetical protein BKA63DRAFT_501081 [Paraphoma chrysanthemicola]|nr:hypothetical protein BKA63DRAFT_501081 [Paraphoma chrysanthemicola]
MNAESYLRKQGWKGSGHSLDSTGRGIKKPLLIAHKQDQLGLGKKKAAWTTDDQWWMRAFDESLKSIGTGEESTLSQIRSKGINRGGLYGFFVKGEAIAGTIDDTSSTDTSVPPSGASTPPTSVPASDAEASSKPSRASEKKTKRKREADAGVTAKKKAKMEKKSKSAGPAVSASTKKMESSQENKKSTKDEDAVTRKINKMTSEEKATAEERAAAKKQTLHEYILRRIQKKADKNSSRYDESDSNPHYFTDLEGDPTLFRPAWEDPFFVPDRPVLGLVPRAAEPCTPRPTPSKAPSKAPRKAIRETDDDTVTRVVQRQRERKEAAKVKQQKKPHRDTANANGKAKTASTKGKKLAEKRKQHRENQRAKKNNTTKRAAKQGVGNG